MTKRSLSSLILKMILVGLIPATWGCNSGEDAPSTIPPDGGSLPAGSKEVGNAEVEGQMQTIGISELQQYSADEVLRLSTEERAVYHRVESGETLWKIARKYGKTADQLLESNGLDRVAYLQPGQLIYIPK